MVQSRTQTPDFRNASNFKVQIKVQMITGRYAYVVIKSAEFSIGGLMFTSSNSVSDRSIKAVTTKRYLFFHNIGKKMVK